MQQTRSPERKPADHPSTTEQVTVPLLCIMGAIAVLAVAGYIWMIALWSSATSG